MKISRFKYLIKIFVTLFILSCTLPVSAQNLREVKISPTNDSHGIIISSLIELQADYLKKKYSDIIEAPKELINGKEYEPYYTRSKIKPLLLPDKERTASIITNTRRYYDLTLQYDTYLDEVVYTDTSRTINYRFPQIALNKNILEGFNLYFLDDSMTFRLLRLPECSSRNLSEGFYEVAYEGKSQYLIKHESTFYVREGLNNYKYSPKNYISVGNSFNRIKSAKSLLQLFGEKSDDVREFLQASGIKVRKANRNQIISVLKYFDSLQYQ